MQNILRAILLISMLNFFAFWYGALILGGDAVNGKEDGGRFFISFADGDCRLPADRGNRHCAKALRSAILFCNTGLLDITCLYEGNSHVEDKT